MALNNFDEDQFDQENIGGGEFEPEPEKPRSNRTFLIILAILGFVFVVILGLVLFYGSQKASENRIAAQEQAAQINANNTATAMSITGTALAQQQAAQMATKTPVMSSAGGAGPTRTPVVVVQANTPVGSVGGGLSASELATAAYWQTQVASRALATPAPTSTALPTTGFFNDNRLSLGLIMIIVLVGIIYLSRRYRLNPR